MHYAIGQAGHLAVIVSFVASLVAAFSYFFTQKTTLAGQSSSGWLLQARIAFGVHAAAIVTVIICLFTIIAGHYYEYHYAWDHSSNDLPVHYMISCFWEGQEGSFLLWAFWHVLIGGALVLYAKDMEASVMLVICVVQAFLTSMILGIDLWGTQLGSSPFILLREYMGDIPVFKKNPDFIPADGTGLNPLLQNYWMVIHPPTLFLGFALTVVPYAYAMAGLALGHTREWIRPALPWMIAATAVLGLGILMGGYWAYETLNFGGYWNWDPVENAVYVPWLVMVASLHTMVIFRQNGTALRLSAILVSVSFILILYSTFLTRSGVLNNASVHAFTDLGLMNQLVIYLFFFIITAIVLIVIRWKEMPATDKELSLYHRDFWVFMGVTTLCLAAFQCIAITSIPVYNELGRLFGTEISMALPADQVVYFSQWQMWFAMAIAVLSGVGQYFYWQKMDAKKIWDSFYGPLVTAAILITIIVTFGRVYDVPYMILVACASFSFTANVGILINILRKSPHLSGGSVAHIGMAVMLVGILFSAGYSRVVSVNVSNDEIFEENPEENAANTLLFRGTPKRMDRYTVLYAGNYVDVVGYPGYVNKEETWPTSDARKLLLTRDQVYKGKTLLKMGDTVEVNPENSYYKLELTDENKKSFVLYPRAQVNPDMGLIASPDIHHTLGADLYAHVSSIPDPKEGKPWTLPEELNIQIGDTFFLADRVAVFEKVEVLKEVPWVKLDSGDAAAKAIIRVPGFTEDILLEPVFIIKDGYISHPEFYNGELAMKITLDLIDHRNGKFVFSYSTTRKEYVVLKATEKPLINLLWTGAVLILIGFGVAFYRRTREYLIERQ